MKERNIKKIITKTSVLALCLMLGVMVQGCTNTVEMGETLSIVQEQQLKNDQIAKDIQGGKKVKDKENVIGDNAYYQALVNSGIDPEQAREMVEKAEGKSYAIDHEAEESLEAREQEKIEKAMDIQVKDKENVKEKNPEIKLLEEKYNGLTKSELLLVDDWKNDNTELNNNGYCMTLLQEGGKVKIMTFDETKKYFEDYFTNNGLTYSQDDFGKSYEIHEEVLGKIKKKQAQVQAEDFSKLVKSHLKEGSGVASVENDMNTFGYTINNLGYVVQNEQAVNYMKSLRGDNYNLYRQTEMEVFKRNNYGKVNVVNKKGMSTSYSEGTFDNQGNPLWVCREANFGTTNAVGEKVYANVNYGYEEFREYCGGTSIAFKGWGDIKNDPNAQKSWCDTHNLLDKNLGQFVDWCWDWVGGEGQRSFKKIG